MEGGMDNRILTISKAVLDMSKFLAILSTKMAGQGVMEDGSHTDKVRIAGYRLVFDSLITY